MSSEMLKSSIFGKCHCGKVEWEAEPPPKIVLNCHCNMCRLLSGADYSSWIIFPTENYSVKTGTEYISDYQATDTFSKSFCRNCGSTISCVNNAKFPQHTYVARGNISSDFDSPVDIQVYTEDKASWVALNEDIPAFNP